MSEASPTAVPAAPATPAAPVPRPRRRWGRRILLGFVVSILVGRVALAMAIGPVASSVAASLGLDLGWGRLHLRILGGSVELDDLVVALAPEDEETPPGADGAPASPLLKIRHVRADLAVLQLFTGRVVVRNVELEGVRLEVTRAADGSLPALEHILKRVEAMAEPDVDSDASDAGTASDGDDGPDDEGTWQQAWDAARDIVGLPVSVERVAVRDVAIVLHDASVDPPLSLTVAIEASVWDLLTSADETGEVELAVFAPPAVEHLHATGHLRVDRRSRTAGFVGTFGLTGLNPAALEGHLGSIGLAATGERVDARGRLELTARPELSAQYGLSGELTVNDLTLRTGGTETAALELFRVVVRALRRTGIDVDRVDVDGARVAASRDAEGGIRFAGIRVPPSSEDDERSTQDVGADDAGAEDGAEDGGGDPGHDEPVEDEAPGALTLGPEATGARVRLRCDRVTVRRVEARFVDAAADPDGPPVELAVRVPEMRVLDLHFDPERVDAPLELDALVELPGVIESIAIEGSAVPFAPRRTLTGKVRAGGITAARLAPYLRAAGLDPELTDGRAELGLTAAAWAEDGALVAETRLEDVAFADGELHHVGVGRVTVGGVRLDPEAGLLSVGSIEVNAPRARLHRDASGVLHAFGIAVVGTDDEEEPADEEAEAPPADSADAESEAPPALRRIELESLVVRNARIAIEDEAVGEEPLRLAVEGIRVNVRDLIVPLEGEAPEPAPLSIRATIPGIAGQITARGQLVAAPANPSVELAVDVTGVTVEALTPYLAPLGIEPDLEDGRFALRLSAQARVGEDDELHAGLSIPTLRFTDGEQELAALEGLVVDDVAVGADDEGVSIGVGRVTLARAALPVWRIDGDEVRALGFRVSPPEESASDATEAAEDGDASGPGAGRGADRDGDGAPAGGPDFEALGALPKLHVGRLAVETVELTFTDATFEEPVVLPFAMSASLDALTIGPAPRDGPPASSTFRATMAAGDLIEAATVEGELSIATHLGFGLAGSVRATTKATGVDAKTLAPYLALAGVEPTLENGVVEGGVRLDAALMGSSIRVDLGLDDAVVRDGEHELLGLTRATLEDVSVASDRIAVGAVTVTAPRIAVARTADGGIEAIGIRLPPEAPPEAEAARVRLPVPVLPFGPWPPPPWPEPDAGVVGDDWADPELAAGSGVDSDAEPAALPVLALGRLAIEAAELTWQDEGVGPPFRATVRAALTITDLEVGPEEGPPASIVAVVTSPGLIGEARLEGQIAGHLEGGTALLTADVRGIRGEALAPYLPSGTRVTLVDGRAGARIAAAARELATGDWTAAVDVRQIALRDGDGPPLASIDRAGVLVARIDPTGAAVEIDRVYVHGIRAEAERRTDGAILAGGLALGPGVTPGAPSSLVAGGLTLVAQRPPAAPPPPTPAEVEAATKRRAIGDGGLPLVTLRKLEVTAPRIAVHDRTRAPIEIRGFVLRNRVPFEMLGEAPAEHPAFELDASLEIAPIASSVTFRVRAAPFALDPEVTVDVDTRGIRAAGIAAALPELEPILDGRGLADGRFVAQLHARLRADRRSSLDFDLSRGFGAEVRIEKVALREAGSETILAGVDSVDVDLARMDPASGLIHIRSIEIERPIARVRWDEASGLVAAGLGIRTPEPEPEPAEDAPDEASDVAPDEAADDAAEVPPPEPELEPAEDAGAPPELRIDRISIDGIDVEVVDARADPPFRLPVTGLEMSVRNLSTIGLFAGQPVSFDMLVTAGDVDLPRRGGDDSLIPGTALLADAVGAIAGGEDDGEELEARPAFAEIGMVGRIALGPTPDGELTFGLVDFDLSNLRGMHKVTGVTIRDGLLGVSAEARFDHDGSLETSTEVVLTDLSMKDSDEGAIADALGLSVPLDAAIFVIRDENGTMKVPFDLTLPSEGLSMSRLTAAALKTVGSVVGRAIARSPLRVLGGVTDVAKGVGSFVPGSEVLFGDGGEETGPALARLSFAAGSSIPLPDAAARDRLAALVAALANDDDLVLIVRHELGRGDIEVANLLANPDDDDARAVAAGLSARRATLLRRRADIAATARTTMLTGDDAAVERACEALRAHDAAIGRLEERLDVVYGLLAAGAERRADRRTRGSATGLARARMDAVSEILVERGLDPSALEGRVRLSRARARGASDSETGVIVVEPAKRKTPG